MIRACVFLRREYAVDVFNSWRENTSINDVNPRLVQSAHDIQV